MTPRPKNATLAIMSPANAFQYCASTYFNLDFSATVCRYGFVLAIVGNEVVVAAAALPWFPSAAFRLQSMNRYRQDAMRITCFAEGPGRNDLRFPTAFAG